MSGGGDDRRRQFLLFAMKIECVILTTGTGLAQLKASPYVNWVIAFNFELNVVIYVAL